MPESAARINPLRPRVCTIYLCLGEPPLRGARVRADSLVLCSSLTRIRSYTRDITLVTLTRTLWWGRDARYGSPTALLNPCGYLSSKREGYLRNPSVEHH